MSPHTAMKQSTIMAPPHVENTAAVINTNPLSAADSTHREHLEGSLYDKPLSETWWLSLGVSVMPSRDSVMGCDDIPWRISWWSHLGVSVMAPLDIRFLWVYNFQWFLTEVVKLYWCAVCNDFTSLVCSPVCQPQWYYQHIVNQTVNNQI